MPIRRTGSPSEVASSSLRICCDDFRCILARWIVSPLARHQEDSSVTFFDLPPAPEQPQEAGPLAEPGLLTCDPPSMSTLLLRSSPPDARRRTRRSGRRPAPAGHLGRVFPVAGVTVPTNRGAEMAKSTGLGLRRRFRASLPKCGRIHSERAWFVDALNAGFDYD